MWKHEEKVWIKNDLDGLESPDCQGHFLIPVAAFWEHLQGREKAVFKRISETPCVIKKCKFVRKQKSFRDAILQWQLERIFGEKRCYGDRVLRVFYRIETLPQKWIERFAPLTRENPYKSCIYRICRDLLFSNGYDLGTEKLFFFSWSTHISFLAFSRISSFFEILFLWEHSVY